MRILINIKILIWLVLLGTSFFLSNGQLKTAVAIKAGIVSPKLNSNTFYKMREKDYSLGMQAVARGKKLGVGVDINFARINYYMFDVLKDSFWNNFLSNYGKNSTLQINRIILQRFQIPVYIQYKFMNLIWLEGGGIYEGVFSIKDKDQFFKDINQIYDDGSKALFVGANVTFCDKITFNARYVLGISKLNLIELQKNWRKSEYQFYIAYKLF